MYGRLLLKNTISLFYPALYWRLGEIYKKAYDIILTELFLIQNTLKSSYSYGTILLDAEESCLERMNNTKKVIIAIITLFAFTDALRCVVFSVIR